MHRLLDRFLLDLLGHRPAQLGSAVLPDLPPLLVLLSQQLGQQDALGLLVSSHHGTRVRGKLGLRHARLFRGRKQRTQLVLVQGLGNLRIAGQHAVKDSADLRRHRN